MDHPRCPPDGTLDSKHENSENPWMGQKHACNDILQVHERNNQSDDFDVSWQNIQVSNVRPSCASWFELGMKFCVYQTPGPGCSKHR